MFEPVTETHNPAISAEQRWLDAVVRSILRPHLPDENPDYSAGQ